MAPSPQSPLCPVLRNLPLYLKMPLNDDPDNAEAPLGTPATLDGEDQGEEGGESDADPMRLHVASQKMHGHQPAAGYCGAGPACGACGSTLGNHLWTAKK